MTDAAETFARFQKVTGELLHVPSERIVADAHFYDDLDADSLDLVELVLALEEEFGVTVDESEIEGIETVRQAFALVTDRLG